MKFLANMNDPQYMKEFHNIIITLSKLCKECLMDIRSEKLYFMANEEQTVTSTAPLVWLEINVKCYFNNYIMEGLVIENEENTSTSSSHNGSSNDNRIMLTVSPIHLSRALNALKLMARSVKMKLINLQFPCLRIEVDVVQSAATVSAALSQKHGGDGNIDGNGIGSGEGVCHDIYNNKEQLCDYQAKSERQIVHDVPVSIITRSDWSYYRIPKIPNTKFRIRLKSYRLMKNLIDKLKNISPSLMFEAKSDGVLFLTAKTEMATITMRYKHLEIYMASKKQQETPQQEQEQDHHENVEAESVSSSLMVNSNLTQIMASCSVDCKKAATFLTALQISTAALDCAIDDDHLIHLQVNIRAGVVAIHSILPALCL